MIQKISFVLVCCGILSTFVGFSQEKADISLILSSNNKVRIGFEYRLPSERPLRFRLGFNLGTSYQSNAAYRNSNIVSTSDSLVVYRNYHNDAKFYNLTAGLERRIGNSMFSFGFDLFLGYHQRTLYQYNIPLVLTENGEWLFGKFVSEAEYNDSQNQTSKDKPIVIGESNLLHIKQEFLNPGASLLMNMDVPISNSFLLYLGASYNIGVPIYMGISKFIDKSESYFGTPPSIIYQNLNAKIGLRYIFGGLKNS